jgi:hypothetical protein
MPACFEFSNGNRKVPACSVVDSDPHSFGCPGSGSVLGMMIRMQENEKLTKMYK